MAEQHVKIFEGLGLSKEVIDQVEGMTPEQLKDWDPASVTSQARDAVKNILMNDAEFLNAIPEDKIPEATRKKFEAGQYTRFQKEILDAATKKLGLEDKDMADWTENDKKSIQTMVVKISEKVLAKKGNVEGLQQMQRDVQTLTEKLEKTNEDWEAKMTEAVTKTNGAAQTKMVKLLTRVELSNLEGVDLNVSPSFIQDQLLARLTDKYSVVLNSNDELELKQKDNVALDVMEGGKKVTFQEALKKLVLENKLGTEKKEEEDPGKRKKVIVGGGEGGDSIEIPSYINEKIEKNEGK